MTTIEAKHATCEDDDGPMSIASCAALDGVSTGAVRSMLDVVDAFVDAASMTDSFVWELGMHAEQHAVPIGFTAICPQCDMFFEVKLGNVGRPRRFCSDECCFCYNHCMQLPKVYA